MLLLVHIRLIECFGCLQLARKNLQLFATDSIGRKGHRDWVCAQSGKKQAGGFNALLLFCYSTARWAAPCTCRNLGLLEGVGSNEWEDKHCTSWVLPGLWLFQVLPFGGIASLCESRMATTVEDHEFSTDCLKNHIFYLYFHVIN